MSAPPPTAEQQQWIEQCQGLVRSLALQIHRKLPANIDLEDLIAYGQLGLVEAARSFDAGRGCQFSTFAYYRIRGAIYDGAAKMSWGWQEDETESPVSTVDAAGTHGAPAQPAGSRPAGVEGTAGGHRPVRHAVVSLAVRQTDDAEQDGEPGWLVDALQAAPLATAMENEANAKLGELIDALPHEAAALIRATYFEGLTRQEASERLGLSKSWASRVRARALESLAQSLASWSGR
jgi:RNA polymerase sigma factor for flagellar operon FliA